ncbi:restriction system modified-DNA reader domain-containing protein [Streptomyces sp. NPDC056039]|uniref:restriction system modified-DNA reader domain-containing protein n=1 Tax=Streptomyces sp. NPDC056039 TaxID=3345687 RepID=UPI0035DBA85B
MSGHDITVDSEVFERLQREAQPLIDTPNSVLRRLLALDSTADRSGALTPLLDAGKLQPGQLLVWRRRNLGHEYRAHVTAEGNLQLEDGRIYDSPSGACSALTQGSVNGWDAWRTDGGASLNALRGRH